MLVLALRSQGKFTEADPLYLRAIEICERVLGADHPDLAISLATRGQLLSEQVCVYVPGSSHLRHCVDCDVPARVTQVIQRNFYFVVLPHLFPLCHLRLPVRVVRREGFTKSSFTNKQLSTAKSQNFHSSEIFTLDLAARRLTSSSRDHRGDLVRSEFVGDYSGIFRVFWLNNRSGC